MPSLNLTPDLIPRFICLPGTALIKCSSAELMTESGRLFKPEAAADWERKNLAVRQGAVVKLDRGSRGSGIALPGRMKDRHEVPTYKSNHWWDDSDSKQVRIGTTVYYLGRQDEADDEYVVVKIGQIVAVVSGC